MGGWVGGCVCVVRQPSVVELLAAVAGSAPHRTCRLVNTCACCCVRTGRAGGRAGGCVCVVRQSSVVELLAAVAGSAPHRTLCGHVASCKRMRMQQWAVGRAGGRVGGWVGVCALCGVVGCGVASGGGWLCTSPDVSPCKHMCMLLRAHWAGGRAGGRASEQARLAARPAQLAAPLGLPSCPRMTALGCRVSCSYTRVQGPRQRARSS